MLVSFRRKKSYDISSTSTTVACLKVVCLIWRLTLIQRWQWYSHGITTSYFRRLDLLLSGMICSWTEDDIIHLMFNWTSMQCMHPRESLNCTIRLVFFYLSAPLTILGWRLMIVQQMWQVRSSDTKNSIVKRISNMTFCSDIFCTDTLLSKNL